MRSALLAASSAALTGKVAWVTALPALFLAGCFVQSPSAGNKAGAATLQHADFISTNTCASCHETNRPAPTASTAHGGGQDCAVCHTPSDTNAGWLLFNHVPTPTACAGCHTWERPPAPHPTAGDCVGCHMYTPGAWQPGT